MRALPWPIDRCDASSLPRLPQGGGVAGRPTTWGPRARGEDFRQELRFLPPRSCGARVRDDRLARRWSGAIRPSRCRVGAGGEACQSSVREMPSLRVSGGLSRGTFTPEGCCRLGGVGDGLRLMSSARRPAHELAGAGMPAVPRCDRVDAGPALQSCREPIPAHRQARQCRLRQVSPRGILGHSNGPRRQARAPFPTDHLHGVLELSRRPTPRPTVSALQQLPCNAGV